jgi:hypothetical protein
MVRPIHVRWRRSPGAHRNPQAAIELACRLMDGGATSSASAWVSRPFRSGETRLHGFIGSGSGGCDRTSFSRGCVGQHRLSLTPVGGVPLSNPKLPGRRPQTGARFFEGVSRQHRFLRAQEGDDRRAAGQSRMLAASNRNPLDAAPAPICRRRAIRRCDWPSADRARQTMWRTRTPLRGTSPSGIWKPAAPRRETMPAGRFCSVGLWIDL